MRRKDVSKLIANAPKNTSASRMICVSLSPEKENKEEVKATMNTLKNAVSEAKTKKN